MESSNFHFFKMEKESLETKLRNLESKVIRLEERVEHQERRLHNLTEQLAAVENELTLAKSVEPTDVHGNRQSAIYQTCHETRAADSSFKSGMYWIDPDGKGVDGDEPIRVHCNMMTGINRRPKGNVMTRMTFLITNIRYDVDSAR